MEQIINEYKPYISDEGFQHLKEFIDSMSNNLTFRKEHKSILCFRGPGNNGKTTLLRRIVGFLGNKAFNISNFDFNQNVSGIKLYFCDDFDFVSEKHSAIVKLFSRNIDEDATSIDNFRNFVCVINTTDNIDPSLLNRFVFVDFLHTFTK